MLNWPLMLTFSQLSKKIHLFYPSFIHKIHRWMPMSNFHYFYLYFITHFIIDNEQQQKYDEVSVIFFLCKVHVSLVTLLNSIFNTKFLFITKCLLKVCQTIDDSNIIKKNRSTLRWERVGESGRWLRKQKCNNGRWTLLKKLINFACLALSIERESRSMIS